MLFGGGVGGVRERTMELDVPGREWRFQFANLHRISHARSDG